ncbi:MAG: hypothetical protein HY926_11625 [Elusimicrobia bacterium]|nr:hypothetical protein [Elusimicrobiota bacterium]
MSNLPNWSHFSRPHHEGLRAFCIGILAGLLLAVIAVAGVLLGAPEWFGGLARQLRLRHDEKSSLSAVVRDAQRLGITYDQVAAKPQDYAGKPVHWCVDHPDPKVSFLEGRPSQPLVWSNDEAVLRTGPNGHCTMMLATVEGAGPEGVRLRLLGLP